MKSGDIPETITCRICGKTLPRSEFYNVGPAKHQINYKASACKICKYKEQAESKRSATKKVRKCITLEKCLDIKCKKLKRSSVDNGSLGQKAVWVCSLVGVEPKRLHVCQGGFL